MFWSFINVDLILFNVILFRYYEAVELCKSLKDKTTSKNDNIFKMSNILVGKIKDNISPNNKNDLNKNVFSNKGKLFINVTNVVILYSINVFILILTNDIFLLL